VKVLSIVQDTEGTTAEILTQSLAQGDMTVSSAIQAARTGTAAELPLGGINLNPVALDLQIKRDGNGVPLPLSEQRLRDVDVSGFFPVILEVASGGDVLSARLGLMAEQGTAVE